VNHFGAKAKIVIFFFLCLISSAFSQTGVDSLLKELTQAKSKSKSSIYNQLAETELENSPEQSLKYAHQAMEEAKRENNNRQKGFAFFNIAEVFVNRYEADSAIYNCQRS
jgi:hypothetical protein